MCKTCAQHWREATFPEEDACAACRPFIGQGARAMQRAGVKCLLVQSATCRGRSCAHQNSAGARAMRETQQPRAVAPPEAGYEPEGRPSQAHSASRAMRRPEPSAPSEPGADTPWPRDALQLHLAERAPGLDVPAGIAAGRGRFNKPVDEMLPSMKSKAKATATATLAGAAALQSDDVTGTVGLALGELIKHDGAELTAARAKRTQSGEAEAEAAEKKLKASVTAAAEAAAAGHKALRAQQKKEPPAAQAKGRAAPSSTRAAAKRDAEREEEEALAELVGRCQLAAGLKGAEALREHMKGKQPRERRQFLSLVAFSHTKEEVEDWLGESVHHQEWTDARKHWRFPGPGKPLPEVKHTRQKIPTEMLNRLLAYLGRVDNHQQYAFGTKLIAASDGRLEELAKVDRLKRVHELVAEFLTELDADLTAQMDLPPSEERCDCCEGSSGKGRQCLLRKGHTGTHKYTGKGSLSRSTLYELIGTLTGDDIKSLAGLCDVSVVKGRTNFLRMRTFITEVSEHAGLDEAEVAALLKRVDETENFLRIGFMRHLDACGDRSCNCLACKLHSETDADHCVDCSSRGSHDVACEDCTAMESLLQDLIALQAKAERAVASRKRRLGREPRQPQALRNWTEEKRRIAVAEEDLGESAVNREQIEADLRFYKGHLGRKRAESLHDEKELRELADGEAIVTCDWKMKVLSAYFRENQNLWFGKRGTSCIGFMVVTNSPTTAGEKDVGFFFLFTDDGNQDAWSVATAKQILYGTLLPKAFPDVKRVRYRSDGAGCFSSDLSRLLQTIWHEWTGITEISVRVSVSGGGKSDLDGRFAFLSEALRSGVNSGKSHWNAKTSIAAATARGPLKSSLLGEFTPIRPDDPPKAQVKGGWKGTCPYHHSELMLGRDGKAEGLRFYFTSGFGAGRVIAVAGVELEQPDSAASPPQPHRDIVDLSQAQAPLKQAIATTSKSGRLTKPVARALFEHERVHRPGHLRRERAQVETALLKIAGAPSRRDLASLDRRRAEREAAASTARPTAVLGWSGGTAPSPPEFTLTVAEEGSEIELGTASDGDSYGRKQKQRQKRQHEQRSRAQAQRERLLADLRAAKLHPCDGCDPDTQRPCHKLYATATGLRKHRERVAAGVDTHRGIGGTTARDRLVRMAAEGSVARVGALPDRCSAAPAVDAVAGRRGAPRDAAGRLGQFIRPPPEPPYLKTAAQVRCLTTLYDVGSTAGERKLNETEIWERMRDMRDSEGRRFFSHRAGNANGKLLPPSTIRSWISSHTQAQKRKRRAAAGAAGSDAGQGEQAGGAGEGEEYEVDEILNKRVAKGSGSAKSRTEYLVSWKGFPRDDATWEPMANLEGSAELISAYERTVNAS